MNNLQPEYSKEKILKNVKYTATGATIIFLTLILPAEYGIDPFGTGKLTGLNKLAPNYVAESIDSQESSETLETGTSVTQDTVNKQVSNTENTGSSYEYKELEKTYTLEAGEDREVKFDMNKGDEMRFSWQSSEVIYFDQHGEPTTEEGKEFLPYKTVKEGKQSSDEATLTAEFTGTHGWYWRNLSNNKVTITLVSKGNFK
ncbi:hypothetical protein GW846_01585 [Candidatus Gracilibacteria bacterium]|nr:hypothetical protein [Candidatus Gracilibacteria bacterium]